MEKKNYLVIILVAILFLIIGGCCIYFVINDKNSNTNSFNMKDETGKVVVTGYPTIKIKKNSEYEGAEEYEYVYFNIVETQNKDFLNFIVSNKGNAFVSDNAIGIGCLKNNTIEFVNYSDELEYSGGLLNTDDTSKILNASKNNPIKLELEKLKITEAGHAPECYSHMTYIKVID